jgi:molybdenum cofactor cytidylyltransferase
MIAAVVLAAGQSLRMGRPKPLLRFSEERTFLGQIVSVLGLSRVDRIMVVLGAQAEEIRVSVDLSGVDVVINKDYRKGQLSSLIAALTRVSAEVEAAVLCLVDNPFITPEIVDRLVGAFRETEKPIVVPIHGGRRGHPTLFARSVFQELIAAPADQGARYVLHATGDRIAEVEVPDPAIHVSVDTPGQYRSCFGTDP